MYRQSWKEYVSKWKPQKICNCGSHSYKDYSHSIGLIEDKNLVIKEIYKHCNSSDCDEDEEDNNR
jgi:hypothetical protein